MSTISFSTSPELAKEFADLKVGDVAECENVKFTITAKDDSHIEGDITSLDYGGYTYDLADEGANEDSADQGADEKDEAPAAAAGGGGEKGAVKGIVIVGPKPAKAGY